MHMDGSGIIDVLDGAFGICRRCLHIVHKNQPYPCAFRPARLFRNPRRRMDRLKPNLR